MGKVIPQVADVMAALNARPGVEIALFSGAVPTCFGIFASASGDAAAAPGALKAAHGTWWIEASLLSSRWSAAFPTGRSAHARANLLPNVRSSFSRGYLTRLGQLAMQYVVCSSKIILESG